MNDVVRSRSSVLLRVLLVGGTSLWATAAAAQNPVTLVSVSGSGNFHAGGVVATVSGDLNFNASAALEWRPSGGAFLPAHPLARIDATHFVGSLFGLSPATIYEARITLTDPDGAAGSPQVATFATRADTLPEPTLRTRYVSTTGNDGFPGTSAMPWRTIQHAADLSQAGDLILIQPGVYRETVSVPTSGSAAQPIVFRGNGPGAILDGADAAIAAGVTWTAGASGVYSRVLGFPTGHVVTEAGRLYQYTSLALLQGLGAGAPGGFFFDGTTLFVKFPNGSSPATHTMNVARREDGFFVSEKGFVRIENLEIRHFGSGEFGKGVYLRYSSDCTVSACHIHDVGKAGVWVKGGDRNRIQDNEIWDTSIFNWPWALTKGSSAENNGVAFTDEIGRGNVVRRNTIHGTFNGMGPCGSSGPLSGALTNETDLYDNVLYQHTDDAFEPEGYCSNVRLWNNQVSYVHMAVAAAPAAPGPLWILRNVLWRFGATRTSQLDGAVASALKINSGEDTPVGPLFLYHNTILTDAAGTDAISLLEPGNFTYIRARNNVVAGVRYALDKRNTTGIWDGNGDDFYTTGATLVRWHGTPYANLSAYRAGQGQELLGLSAPPQLVSPTGGIFDPAPGSPLIDSGIVLPGINDGFQGTAPDVGAIETSGPPPELSFYTVPPCRVADTRSMATGGPALGGNTTRTFAVTGRCGIPAGAKAVALNATVVGPTGLGDLRLYPAGTFAPGASTINFSAGKTRANNAVISLGGGGQISVRCDMAPSPPGQTHFLFDVTGYFQ
jgi:parallel beta-helix repeat protein